ncbi:hypothetical protein BFV94_4892 [Alteromonas macleodii]|uniref:Uncharacterized protein n=1 Tax=Alteromonas macleodii TaxID=28108 RepID=A0AB36FSN5_ALTMA|nr:hypothetical protein BFV93_4920 [Alteromonas macleodii]OES23942.1 hypothetical protein BFV94_4892 [Alteromonas macleodii]OES25642.1 hypothetical protein BFV95_4324 [Alteromonas macleodii]OES38946.1 hypothetical protein BFV96_4544 [Alteromonas macleodii]
MIAQESIAEPLKFVVVAINSNTQMAYAKRHGRIDELITWRLDNLAKILKKHGVDSFETQYQKIGINK